MTTLFDPVQIGDLPLPNRIVMAPLTRLRAANPVHVPNALMAEYYAQRASAGLIVSEGVPVMPDGVGYPNVPGLWSEEQVGGWQIVTRAVHEAGGRIVAQLWHVGRITHPDLLDGRQPVGPSAIAAKGNVSLLRPQREYVVPRELSLDEIRDIVAGFARGAANAKAAGFDGVTIHAANGYLLDQFLQDGSNQRTDAYGGPVENRARLLLEVADAVAAVWGPGRVGVHLAPRSPSHSMADSNPSATFGYVARELGQRKIGFLFVRETRGEGALLPQLKREFGGAVIANDGFDLDAAQAVLAEGHADAVSFGRAYIANPDLVERLRQRAPLNEVNPATIYDLEHASGTGYTDYPLLAAS
ncbi:alkene reductase [Cupriavidus plantarum]|uniref:2,4-dienoyl-CoA reductase-like NADH-dependent reductase (Old Yellow Enzyme family) n=1 Tax=Cupriavidus plantarum TaxID=942865 RepID=A0A316EXL3_9BURK|nr:alkene reductase [Cupriavidus plantarum]PWK37467.1 2,4-dienoyl-CoA reductase-like NADH-dependent reductase (Old Yellow Enzyme family) [Cupriavidus plantarum]